MTGTESHAPSVFLNYPFDDDFRPTLDAIILAVVCCGFVPISAVATGKTALRLDRIARCIESARYSVHDLSRCQGGGDENLARFNMPLELGMVLGWNFAARTEEESREWVALVPRGAAIASYISDLNGFDPLEYDGNPESVVAPVMAWLSAQPEATTYPTPDVVVAALPAFRSARESIDRRWLNGRAPWKELIKAAVRAAPQ